MADAASLIREGKLLEQTIPVCLRPDLVRAYEKLAAEIEELRESHKSADSMLASPDVSDRQGEMNALEEEMRENTIPFVFRALSRTKFRKIWAEHPPRQAANGNPAREDLLGVNSSTFFTALLRASAVSPELDDETWEILLDEKLSDRQYHDLANACFALSQDRVNLPFTFAV